MRALTLGDVVCAAARETPKVRQWRITVSEGAAEGLMMVDLAWRTFPCSASEWDGVRYSKFVHAGARIASPDDLRSVLAMAVEGDWYEDVRRTRSVRA